MVFDAGIILAAFTLLGTIITGIFGYINTRSAARKDNASAAAVYAEAALSINKQEMETLRQTYDNVVKENARHVERIEKYECRIDVLEAKVKELQDQLDQCKDCLEDRKRFKEEG